MTKDADLQISLRDSLRKIAGRIFSNSRQLSPSIWNLHSMTWYHQRYGPQRSEAESESRFQSLQGLLWQSQKSSCIRFAAVTRYNSPTALVGCHMFPRTNAGLKRTTTLHHITSWWSNSQSTLAFFYHGSRAVCAWASIDFAQGEQKFSVGCFHAHRQPRVLSLASAGYVVYPFSSMIESSTSLAVRLDVL